MTDDATLVERLHNVRCAGIEELCWEAGDRVFALEAENAALRERMAWRPIATAPRPAPGEDSGPEVIVLRHGTVTTDNYFVVQRGYEEGFAIGTTRWMPLPAPPATEPGA